MMCSHDAHGRNRPVYEYYTSFGATDNYFFFFLQYKICTPFKYYRRSYNLLTPSPCVRDCVHTLSDMRLYYIFIMYTNWFFLLKFQYLPMRLCNKINIIHEMIIYRPHISEQSSKFNVLKYYFNVYANVFCIIYIFYEFTLTFFLKQILCV